MKIIIMNNTDMSSRCWSLLDIKSRNQLIWDEDYMTDSRSWSRSRAYSFNKQFCVQSIFLYDLIETKCIF